jgi:hypothetical protein
LFAKALRHFWLPLFLFVLVQSAAGLLIVLVILSPWLDNGGKARDGWRLALSLFAHDVTLRQTAVASALALVVTAYACFRPRGLLRWLSGRSRARRPQSVAGA